MAFEAYIAKEVSPPRRTRRLLAVVSIAVHAAAAAVAIAYSFWHVEEITPPVVTVTFVSAMTPPPPPPPPPPLGGGAQAAHHKPVAKPKVIPTPKTPDVVQPVKPEEKHEEPPEAKEPPKAPDTTAPPGPGTPDGTKGGVSGGVQGGTVGGTQGGVVGGTGKVLGTSAPAPKMLPPNLGGLQKQSGADPDFPSYLRKAGTSYLIMAKICVGVTGSVTGVTLMRRAQATLDANVENTVKTWRFRPLMAGGTAVPFCYFGRFEFKGQ